MKKYGFPKRIPFIEELNTYKLVNYLGKVYSISILIIKLTRIYLRLIFDI